MKDNDRGAAMDWEDRMEELRESPDCVAFEELRDNSSPRVPWLPEFEWDRQLRREDLEDLVGPEHVIHFQRWLEEERYVSWVHEYDIFLLGVRGGRQYPGRWR